MKNDGLVWLVVAAGLNIGISLSPEIAQAGWRIEQLRDENGKPYYGWCDDSTCPPPTNLKPERMPAALPPPVSLPDQGGYVPPSAPVYQPPQRLDLSGFKRSQSEAPVVRGKVSKADRGSKQPIAVLAESRNGRTAAAPVTSSSVELEIAEARREAMARSAAVSPVVMLDGGVVARYATPAQQVYTPPQPSYRPAQAGYAQPTAQPVTSDGKVQIMLNPRR